MPRSPTPNQAQIKLKLLETANNPELWCDYFTTPDAGRPWWRQVEIGESVVRYHDTAVYTANGVGKDWWVARLILWWLSTRPRAQVMVFGPSQSVIGGVTWKEVRRAVAGLRFPSGIWTTSAMKSSPQRVVLENGVQALGYSSSSIERLSGQHEPHLLVIIEEASGVEDFVWEAADGLQYERLLAIGNPLRPNGRFIDLIHQAEKEARDGLLERANAIRIPASDHPHSTWARSPWGAVNRTWIEAMWRRYGKDSLWCRSHIDALIPTVLAEMLLKPGWLIRAALTPAPIRKVGDTRGGKRWISSDLGLGVGRDYTVIICRDYLEIIEVWESNTADLATAAAKIFDMARRHSVPYHQISYDMLGIGRNFPDFLHRHDIRQARGYSGAGGAAEKRRFTNLRSEAAWKLRNRLDPEWIPRGSTVEPPPFHIPPADWWPKMSKELEELTYDCPGNGCEIRLIGKDALTERLGHSPDLADALIQSFAYVP